MTFPPKIETKHTKSDEGYQSRWTSIPIRYLSICLDGKRVPLNAEQRSYLPGKVPYWGANAVQGYVQDFIFNETLVLIGEDGAPFFDKTKSVAFLSKGKIWPNNHIHVLRARPHVCPHFLTYSLNVTDYSLYVDGSTRDKLTQSSLNSIVIPTPPLSIQRQIAAYLNRETAKIDRLIAKQRRLIELVQEKRQAVISRAVTKGLDSNVKMKDSGVVWLGEVPEGWALIKLGYVFSMQSGQGITSENIEETGNYPVYGGNGIRGFYEQFTHDGSYLLMGRQGALCGNIHQVEGKFWASEHAVVLTPRLGICHKYMAQLLRHMNLGQYSVSAAQPGLSVDLISKLKIPFPQLDEQLKIGLVLSETERTANRLIEKAATSISLLTEHRQALISAAVTGKIDVRGSVTEEEVAALDAETEETLDLESEDASYISEEEQG